MANSMNQGNPKKQPPQYVNDSILEQLRDVGSNVGKTLSRDVAGKVSTDIISSLTGSVPKSGELKPNEAVNLNREAPRETPPKRSQEFSRPVYREDEHVLKQKIDAVRAELAALSKSLKSLNREVQKAVTEMPVNPGAYHLSFFEQLKSMLTMIRTQVEDSSVWLSAFNSRKNKRRYWGMYKKHGTSFGLSSERTMATQAG